MTLYVTRLSGDHDRTQFNCGKQSLDEWFRFQASQADRRQGSARVFVLVDDEIDGGRRPLGYYALVGHAVVYEELSPETRKGFPQHPVGAVLLARLAIDQPYQHGSGRRLGEMLLADVVRQAMLGDQHVATPLLVVDALDQDSAAFYERYGFQPMLGHELRLVARLRDIRKTFGVG